MIIWLGLLFTAYLLNQPVASRSFYREIIVKKGMSTREVGELLKRERLIKSVSFFVFVANISPAGRKVKAGLHDVNGNWTTMSILHSLKKARDLSRKVTIPEGLTLREIADLLEREAGLKAGKFVALGTDQGFCRELGVEAESLEGYLFPETYRFSNHQDERGVARSMVRQFWSVFGRDMQLAGERLGMSVHQVVTLASIVEREARVAEERRKISGVFHRRLKKGMRLQADPTAEYALGVRKARLLYSDIAVDSPYNTYLHKGLPPGPISNPGRASLLAALNPDDTNYLYFVVSGDGRHVFSRTKREHDRARDRIRRSR